MLKVIYYLQDFDDLYRELSWDSEAKKVLDEIKGQGRFEEGLAFEIVEEHFLEASTRDVRLFVTYNLLDALNGQLRLLNKIKVSSGLR